MRNASNPGVDPPPAAAILDAKGAEKRIEAQARYASGLAFELNGRPEEALRDFILSVRADPSNEEVAMEVSRRLLLAKDAEQAVEIAELAAAVPNASAGMHAHLAVLYAERGQTKDAIRANRRAIELSPGVLTAYYNLYNLHLGQQDD
ncbi:MAG TPA: hypothetical protein DCY13_01635, partial [Verrucomicrobiales bacterium]|nr:hypothetical protein [Verrucomicrobiales bacterium]